MDLKNLSQMDSVLSLIECEGRNTVKQQNNTHKYDSGYWADSGAILC